VLHASVDGAVEEAVAVVQGGGVVAIPTDTLYGLAASIRFQGAVDRVAQVKRRLPEKIMPIVVTGRAQLTGLVSEMTAVAAALADAFWPGPVTLVLPATPSLAPPLVSSAKTVAVRAPAGGTCQTFLTLLGGPATGTSANLSGQRAARTEAEVRLHLGKELDAILADDAAVTLGGPSTVVEVQDLQVVILRVGALPLERIREVLPSSIAMRVPSEAKVDA